jgi:hypothetical protein
LLSEALGRHLCVVETRDLHARHQGGIGKTNGHEIRRAEVVHNLIEALLAQNILSAGTTDREVKDDRSLQSVQMVEYSGYSWGSPNDSHLGAGRTPRFQHMFQLCRNGIGGNV